MEYSKVTKIVLNEKVYKFIKCWKCDQKKRKTTSTKGSIYIEPGHANNQDIYICYECENDEQGEFKNHDEWFNEEDEKKEIEKIEAEKLEQEKRESQRQKIIKRNERIKELKIKQYGYMFLNKNHLADNASSD